MQNAMLIVQYEAFRGRVARPHVINFPRPQTIAQDNMLIILDDPDAYCEIRIHPDHAKWLATTILEQLEQAK